MLVTTTMSEATVGVPVQVGYPSVAESALLSPTRPACVPQDHLEAVLTAHLKELPAARLVTGVDVEDISQEPRRDRRDSASVTLSSSATRPTG
jgi:2-polyprenyl-6-methoxyphenol hydroxylase-like FAD-dependent oxidoreductase